MSDLPVLTGEVVPSGSLPALVPDLDLPLDRNPAAVAVMSKTSEHSRRSMRQALNKIVWYMRMGSFDLPPDEETDKLYLAFDWALLRYQHTAAIRAALQEQYKPSTVNVMLSALRGVIRECANLGYLTADEERAATRIKNVKSETIPAGRDLKSTELYALLRNCRLGEVNRTKADIRDAAIIAILYITGLRRSEVVALALADYDRETEKIHIRAGKGRKERTVYAGEAKSHLELWLNCRGQGNAAAALLLPVNKGDNIVYEQENRKTKLVEPARLSPQAVYNMLKKRGEEAGLKDFSPHDFRRTWVGDMLDAGADLATVQKLAGHASPTTTSRYDRRPEEAKRKAIHLLHIPQPGERL